MNWPDERYVRLYTRDTADWLALSFDAQALLSLLLRKCDRTGVIPLGKHGKRAVAIVIGHAREWPRLEPSLDELLADGCVAIEGDRLIFRNFIDAQESRASDAARAKAYREKQRATTDRPESPNPSQAVTQNTESSRNVTAASQNVTEPSRAVTHRHDASQGVTPSLAVPSRAVPEVPSSGKPDAPMLPGAGPMPAATGTRARRPPALDHGAPSEPVITRVLERWREASGMAKASITGPKARDRRKRIAARLRDGFTEEELLDVSAGAKLDDFLMGTDPGSKPGGYREVDTWFRDPEQCERLIGIARGDAPVATPQPRRPDEPRARPLPPLASTLAPLPVRTPESDAARDAVSTLFAPARPRVAP